MRINQHLFRPPFEATALGVVQAGTSADDEHAHELDVAITERLGKPLGALEIIQVVKPIDQLAEAMLEAGAPFGDGPAARLLEDAVAPPIFQFDDTKFAGCLAAQ